MPGYLFDTDALSFIITNGRLQRYPRYAAFLAGLPRAVQYTCAPVVGELHAGARRAASPEPLLQRIAAALKRLTILPFDQSAAEIYGALRANLEARGNRLEDMDLCIAACALAHGLTLVTGNGRHFSRIGDLSIWLVAPEGVNETGDAYAAQPEVHKLGGRVRDLAGFGYRADLPAGLDVGTLAEEETGAVFAEDDARIRDLRG